MKAEKKVEVWALDFEPKYLKQLMMNCGIRQTDLIDVTGYKKPTISLVVNRGEYMPTKNPVGFKRDVEAYLKDNPKVQQWLFQQGMRLADIWKIAEGRPDMKRCKPVGTGQRQLEGKAAARKARENDTEEVVDMQAEKLADETKKHFKLFRDPFVNDVQSEADVYMSREADGVYADMLDTARHGGFMAVVGEVGSGKSILRKLMIEQLRRDNDALIIQPQTIDKRRLTAAAICTAIVSDVSNEKPLIKLESVSRQVVRLLTDRGQGNFRCALVIEEAHDLSVETLKFLKRFYELEDGFRKLIGIILIAQTELKTDKLSESTGYGMREVIRRCQIRELPALNGDMTRYLEKKFKRISSDLASVFEPKALDALKTRLSKSKGGKTVSHAYPLTVNNYTVRAMNVAAELGAPKVTDEIIFNL